MRALIALALALVSLVFALPVAAETPSRWHSTTNSELEAAEKLRALELGLEADVPDSLSRQHAMLEVFHQELSSYGVWHSHPAYGLIWVPSPYWVGVSFGPYLSHGHWGLDSSANWVWVSEYRFGHVVFHYGRWFQVAGFGWAWVPGFEYAPAWVAWRVPTAGAAYFAWAPLSPRRFWHGGALVHGGYDDHNPWLFCPSAQAFSSHVSRHVRRAQRHRRDLLDMTRPLPQPGFGAGPTVEQVRVPKYRVPARVFAPPASRRAVGARVVDTHSSDDLSRDLAVHDRRPSNEKTRRHHSRPRAAQPRRDSEVAREVVPRRRRETRRVTTLPSGSSRGRLAPVQAPASRNPAAARGASRDKELTATRSDGSIDRPPQRRAVTPRAERKVPASPSRRASAAASSKRVHRAKKKQRAATEPEGSESEAPPPRKRPRRR